jgi:hypothetical protein
MRRIRMAAVLALCAPSIVALATPAHAGSAAVAPQRVLDTRAGIGTTAHALAPGETLPLAVAAAVQAGATSVALNLTATDAGGPGFLTAWPCGQPMPATSVLNFVPGQTVANMVTVGLGAAGICLAASAPVHVVGDLMGWFTGSDDFAGSSPSRLLDTRVTKDPLEAGVERRLPLAAGAGYSGGSGGVALNITVVSPTADGFVTVYPCGPRPLASTVNFRAGEIVPNFTVVPYTGGEVCLYSLVRTDVVVDSFGWGGHGNGLTLESPSRLLDTRNGTGSASGAASPTNTITLRVAGRGGVPNDATAALVTITATGGTADGFVTAWPCDQPRPVASVLNLRPGLLRSNAALLHLSQADGSVCLYAWTVNGSAVHLVVDAVGWIPGSVSRQPPPPEPQPPPPPSGGSGHFGTLPPGSALPGDAECAARVRSAAEVRQANIPYNQTEGHGAPSNPPAALYTRVTGNFTGTTDEILQWAACKWGIDEDIVRAQAAKESWWDQRNVGDNGESFGLLQDRKPYMEWAFNNGVGDAQSSTAYNVDVSFAARRNCFEGNETWLNTVDRGRDYAAGDLWGCVGMWFSGRWYTQPAVDYIAAVQDWLNQRIWETPDFLGYG